MPSYHRLPFRLGLLLLWAISLLSSAHASATNTLTADHTQTPDLRMDVNHARATDLTQLKGIGPRKAAAIIEERERYGLFIDARDLTRVKGISATLADRLATHLSFRRP